MFYSDVIDMLCLYIQQSLFDLLQNSINELLLMRTTKRFSISKHIYIYNRAMFDARFSHIFAKAYPRRSAVSLR